MMDVLHELSVVSGYQKLAFLFSIIYILLAVRNNRICFYFGVISAVFWAYESFFILNLKFDGGLQVFYIIMSLWGLYLWHTEEENQTEAESIKILSLRGHIISLGVGIVLTSSLYFLIAPYLSTNLALWDAGTTVFSMIATYLLVRRYLSNWIYFIVVDVIYIWIYIQSGGNLFAIMMVIYTVMAIWGYVKWKRTYENTLI